MKNAVAREATGGGGQRTRRLGRGRLVVLGLVAVGTLVVAGGALGLSLVDPPPGGSSAPAEPKDCDPLPGKQAREIPAPRRGGGAICGGRGDDTIDSDWGHPIWSYQGNDTIVARNNYPDKIFGGPGRDVAVIDAAAKDGDTVVGVEECRTRPNGGKVACPTVRSARQAQSLHYPGYQAIFECRLEPGTGKRQIWMPLEPMLRAVNSTPRPDWQKVAFTSLLYQMVGTEWKLVAENDWVWDHVYDEQTTVFPGHFWQRFDRKIRWFQWFYPQTAGQFRVAVKYHWYKTPLVPEHEFLAWGGRHYGDLENGTHEWCIFPS